MAGPRQSRAAEPTEPPQQYSACSAVARPRAAPPPEAYPRQPLAAPLSPHPPAAAATTCWYSWPSSTSAPPPTPLRFRTHAAPASPTCPWAPPRRCSWPARWCPPWWSTDWRPACAGGSLKSHGLCKARTRAVHSSDRRWRCATDWVLAAARVWIQHTACVPGIAGGSCTTFRLRRLLQPTKQQTAVDWSFWAASPSRSCCPQLIKP
jgi:hypothetical protein